MSKKLQLNAKSGFVALPLDILEIEMSPGAFRALAEFCRMANADGFCWPSLAQLSEKLGRSKAAISGYVTELRALDLLETERQKTSNGYNYRLKYRVTFWKKWKTIFCKAPKTTVPKDVKPTECSVQPDERIVDKNHNYKNQTSGKTPEKVEVSNLKQKWEGLTAGCQYPEFTAPPNKELIQKTKHIVGTLAPNPKAISVDIKTTVQHFFNTKQVLLSDDQLTRLLQNTGVLKFIPNAPSLILKALKQEWQTHWKYPPSLEFMSKMFQTLIFENPETASLLKLKFFLGQYTLWQKTLPRHRLSANSDFEKQKHLMQA